MSGCDCPTPAQDWTPLRNVVVTDGPDLDLCTGRPVVRTYLEITPGELAAIEAERDLYREALRSIAYSDTDSAGCLSQEAIDAVEKGRAIRESRGGPQP